MWRQKHYRENPLYSKWADNQEKSPYIELINHTLTIISRISWFLSFTSFLQLWLPFWMAFPKLTKLKSLVSCTRIQSGGNSKVFNYIINMHLEKVFTRAPDTSNKSQGISYQRNINSCFLKNMQTTCYLQHYPVTTNNRNRGRGLP